jgi:flavin reductase
MTSGHQGDVRSPDATRRFRRLAGSFATGVTVVTSFADDVPVGMTVNSFATVSLDPTLLLICLHNDSRLLASIRQSGLFAATVLTAQQQRQAQWFANRARPTGAAAFASIPVGSAPVTGCLLLSEGLAYFDCRVYDLLPGGDHAIVLGEVAACGELSRREPLVFVGGEFVALDSRTQVAGQPSDHWPTPVGALSVSAGAAGAGIDGSSSDSGRSTSAIAWAVTTLR